MGYVSELATHGKVVVVDPRGYGESSRCRDEASYSIDTFCDDMLAAADAAGLRQFVAWGYSNTAALSVALAARTNRVVGLACCGMDPLLDFTPPLLHAQQEGAAAGEGDYLPEGHFDWRAVAAFCRDYGGVQQNLSAVNCPSVIVCGSDDALVAPSVAKNRRHLEELGFSIVVVDGLDHQTCVEAADTVTRIVLGKLNADLGSG